MIASKQIAFGGGSKRKPYDAEIEYLESTGTQWIDTRFKPDLSTLSCAIKLKLTTSTNSGFYGLFGVRSAASSVSKTNCSILVNPAIPNFRIDWADPLTVEGVLGKDYEFHCGIGNRVVINGMAYEGTSTPKVNGYADYSFYLFAVNSVGTPMALCKQRVYHAKIYDNDTLVLDLIPVRVGSVGYMYDRVSGELFGNQGTGEFVLGPDLIDYTAKDYVQDGLVAMWDGIENAGFGVHDASATVCKSLVGDFDITGSVYGDNSFTGATGAPSIWYLKDSIFNGNFTLEWALNPSVEIAGVILNVDNSTNGQNRYRVSGVRSGYASYQIYYWDGSKEVTVYPMAKANYHQGAIVFEDGVFSVYGNGGIMKSYSAVAPTDATRASLVPGQTFRNLRVSSRALTAEEIAHNYEIDKARFGLP